MAGLNQVTLIGNLGKDPEVRFTQGGQAVANFSVAINEAWKDKDGVKQERTEWVRVVVWGKAAELCGEYLTKGRQVCIIGKLQTREWDKNGVKQYTTEVVASPVGGVVFLSDGQKRTSGRSDAPPPSAPVDAPPPSNEDIPF